MPKKRCTFMDPDGTELAEHKGSGPNEAVARRAAISQFDWEGRHDDVLVDCR